MRSLCSLNLHGLALVALLLVPAAAAQTAEDVLLLSRRQATLGAELAGQGGAAIGGMPGWTASFSNPANLGWLRTSEATASVDLTGTESDAAYRLSGDDASLGLDGRTLEGSTRSSGARLGHLGYAAKVPTVRGSLVVGLGYNRTSTYDRALFYDAEVTGTLGDGTVVADRFEEDVFAEGQAGELSAAAAVEIAPGVMVGGSVNFLFGSYFTESIGAASFFGDDPVVFSIDQEARGVNARVGISAEAQRGFRLGFVVETPTYVNVVEETIDSFGDLFPVDYDFTTPWRLGAGVVYQIAGATLAADVEYVDWSQARLRTDGFTSEDDLLFIADQNSTLRRTYDDAFTTRFGAAYDFGIATARFGLAYQPDPLRDATGLVVDRARREVAVDAVADRLRRTVTAGVGIRVGRSSEINIALVNTRFEDQLVAIDNVFPDGDDPGTLSNPESLRLVLEDVTRTTLVVGATFGF
ncbi:MAG: hypothetical protein AAFP18_04590 [Bacteroidota bacterium]